MQWKKQAAWLGAAWAIACGGAMAAPQAQRGGPKPTADAQEMAQWVQQTGDAAGRPFLVVDKKAAQLYVYRPDGRLQAATPVLLGAARGDTGVPGVGDRAQSGSLPFDERTTPAGRFVTQPGRNLQGESVVWIDYEAALAIHRLRPGRSHAMRAARLQQSQPDDRRLSLGCVVVPVAFYLNVVEPLLGRTAGVVYVLPETQSTRELITSM
ncbi:MAG: L,D-transpeptidase [Ramlibacter sp.]